jgi:amino acid transporter
VEGERPLVVTEEYERLGGKKLSLVDVLAQSVGFMGPVFSAAFIIPLIIGVNASGRGAGTSAALAVLLAAIGVFALGWIVAQYAKRIHAAGSLYDYVSNGLGKTLGAASGWLYYGGTIILTTGLGLLIGGYVHDNLLPTLEIDLDLPIWLWDSIFALGLFAVLYFGVQISTRVQLTLALISIAVVLIFFITVIADLGADNDVAKAFDPSPAGGFSGILFGVLYGVLIFVGFETAANLAEETAEPKRSIPRAVLGAVAIVSVFYLIAAYVEVAGFGFDLAVITSPEVAGAPLFALGTPIGAILLLIAIQAILIVVSEANDTLLALPGYPHYFSVFVWCATFGGFALLVVYFLMSIGAFRGVGGDKVSAGVIVAALVGIVITAAAIFGSFYKVTSPTLLAPWSAVIWFAIGLVYMALVKGREPASDALADLRTSA